MKLIYRALTIFIVIVSLILFANPKTEQSLFSDNNSSLELMLAIPTYEEARTISILENIELIHFSEHGFATFKGKDTNQYHQLLHNSNYEFIPNHISYTTAPPSRLKEDLTKLYALSMMDTYDAWNLTLGNSSVLVAIIDTGIDTSHQEFIGKISSLSYNAKTKNVGLTSVVDDFGHGTMVAGVIAAIKGNNFGISGIAPLTQLLVIKANEPNEGSFSDSSVIEGIYYAADHGANVINLSLGSPYANPLMKTALEYARSKNVIVVAASGNDSTSSPFFPAAFDSTISVSAVDQLSNLATYSNYGDTISISAPGTNIYTTIRGNSFSYGSGTSLAAPQVSGVLALMLAYLDISDEEIIERLLLTSSDLGTLGQDASFGYGLVNSYDALTLPLVTITLETFGGTSVAPFQVAKGRSFSCHFIPELTGYAFKGWYKDYQLSIPWQEGVDVANADMTLYAKYTQNFYQVSFITSGTMVSSMQVEIGQTFILPTSYLENHSFDGWFIDEQLQIPYVSTPIEQDLILYAKFTKLDIYFNVMFITPGSAIEPMKVNEGSSVPLPTTILEGHHFNGWYLDSNFTIPYTNEPVTAHITLYASFTPNQYQLTYFVDGVFFSEATLDYGTELDLLIPQKTDYDFFGWYIDENMSSLFEGEIMEENLVLYGYFSLKSYTVLFYVDHIIVHTTSVKHGESAILPPPPSKSESSSFVYTFSHWEPIPEAITNDTSVYAVFLKTFKEDSVFLNPGVDTIIIGYDWVDGSITYHNDELTLQTKEMVNSTKEGSYRVDYELYDEEELIYTLSRMVSVVANLNAVVIELLPDVATILVGEEFIDAKAKTNLGTIETIGEVDSTKPGTYVLTYQVVLGQQTFQKSKYVHVIEEEFTSVSLTIAILDKKEWWLS